MTTRRLITDDNRIVLPVLVFWVGFFFFSWLEQIINFIDNVIIPANQIDNASKKLKVHVVGNSVGGYLSVALGNHRPDLVETISLLNATPIWGLNLPGWDGKLPAPPLPKFVGRLLFDQIRDLNTIEKYLEVAYANADAFDEDLVSGSYYRCERTTLKLKFCFNLSCLDGKDSRMHGGKRWACCFCIDNVVASGSFQKSGGRILGCPFSFTM